MLILVSSCQENSIVRSRMMPPPPPPIISRNVSDLYFSKDTNSLYGIYMSPHYNFGATVLGLFPDMRYEYIMSGCVSSSIDSGGYMVRNDTIIFNSSFSKEDLEKPVLSSHGNRTRLIRALLGKHKIVFCKEDAVLLYRKGMQHFEIDGLDKNGNGEAYKLDDMGYMIEKGTYANYELIKGVRNIFTEGEATPERVQIENSKVKYPEN